MTHCLERLAPNTAKCKKLFNEPTIPVAPKVDLKPHKIIPPEVKYKIAQKEKQVFNVFTEALQFFKADEIMFSFNGGKDCTVLLHMLTQFYRNLCLQHISIPVLYIQSPDTFPEIEEFVVECCRLYNIRLIVRNGGIKQVLTDVCDEMPEFRAVFMGSRSTDPYCDKLKKMQPTDPGWPPLMRINPLLDWTHRDIWDYIFINKVPYCTLYDQGYTSVGNSKNTKKNPHLKRYDQKTKTTVYLPAYELPDDDSLERAGRI